MAILVLPIHFWILAAFSGRPEPAASPWCDARRPEVRDFSPPKSGGPRMDGMRGRLVDAGHPDPSLTRSSDTKTFMIVFLYKAGT